MIKTALGVLLVFGGIYVGALALECMADRRAKKEEEGCQCGCGGHHEEEHECCGKCVECKCHEMKEKAEEVKEALEEKVEVVEDIIGEALDKVEDILKDVMEEVKGEAEELVEEVKEINEEDK